MNNYTLIVEDEETGKKAEYHFESYHAFLAKFTEIKQRYNIVQENTLASIVVQKKPDLFS